MNELGASVSEDNIKPYFVHPSDETNGVYLLLDVCHILKLIRNNFKKISVMYDSEGKRIAWEYLEKLAKLQEEEGLR